MAHNFVVQRPLYEEAIASAGGQPVLITPTDDPSELKSILDSIDALLLSGGDDVTPELYGGNPNNVSGANRQRDQFEIQLIQQALKRNLPILAICRGIQILNVAHSGTIRHLRNDPELSDLHGIDMNSFTAHQVTVKEGTLLARILQPGTHQVNSFHGQAVDRPGENLMVCATASDGVIEGIERPDRTFVIGIQWHPEIMSLTDKSALALFNELIRRADAYRSASHTSSTVPTTQPQDHR